MKKGIFAVLAAALALLLLFAACKNDKKNDAGKTANKNEASTTRADLGDRIESELDDVSEKLSEDMTDAGERISEGLSDAGEKVREGVSDVSERISEGISDANETLSSAAENMKP